jgi:hypothetical protein
MAAKFADIRSASRHASTGKGGSSRVRSTGATYVVTTRALGACFCFKNRDKREAFDCQQASQIIGTVRFVYCRMNEHIQGTRRVLFYSARNETVNKDAGGSGEWR